MSKKNKDPFPITDVYHVTDTLVDAATVVVTDLCENLSNSINTYDDGILDDLKKIKTKKFNAISVGNGADGCYPVWVGVDRLNRVRKIFASVNGGLSGGFSFFDKQKNRKLTSWSFNKRDLNDIKKNVNGINVENAFFISSVTGFNIDSLCRKVNEMINNDKEKDDANFDQKSSTWEP